MLKSCVGAATVALVAGAATAGPLVFDPDGSGSAYPSYTVNSLDFAPSSVLAVGGNTAIANFINGSGTTSFMALTHASLQGGALNGVGKFDSSTQPYEITAVLGFGERVISANAATGTATFQFDPTQTSFVRLYYQPVKNANNLLGTGFNDGSLIFQSTVSTIIGSFTSLGNGSVGLLDQANGDSWNGQQTVTGTGSNSSVTVNVATPTVIDKNFFLNTPLLSFIINNVSLETPFTTVDPSYSFTQANNSAYVVTSNQGVTSTLGTINGGLTCNASNLQCRASGPDFEFQTDVNSSVQATTVPEPGTLALVGVALAGIGIGGARRRRA